MARDLGRRFARRWQVWLGVLVIAGAAISGLAEWLGLIGPPKEIVGRMRAVDGDSLVSGEHRIRLVGIDAPEGPQTCTRDGRAWPCGRVATDALRTLIGRKTVRCRVERLDQHDRALAVCDVDGREINAELVRSGHAIAFGRRYRDAERAARNAKRGLWSGSYVPPQEWRRQNAR
ncbi:MAG: thermonuclease family protein [Pseudomonadota bacterium]